MRIVRDWKLTPEDARGAVVAIGNFDGVHLGHRAVLERTAATAGALAAPLGAIIFEPHPVEFFRPDAAPFRLTTLRAKVRLLEALGVDIAYVLRFDAELAAKPAETFVDECLVEALGIRHVVIGYDFHFGKGRAGNAELLVEIGKTKGFGVTVIDPVTVNPGAAVYSSTLIRQYLSEGRPRDAAALLGHWWTVEGHVLAGDKRGRTIGFPTANLRLDDALHPALGVYAVRAEILEGDDAGVYDGVANLGFRPTFDKEDILLETHIFDYVGDLYGRLVRVAFVEYIRPERKFDGLDSLKAQIAADSEKARGILADDSHAASLYRVEPLRR